jgi:hypothetical protein
MHCRGSWGFSSLLLPSRRTPRSLSTSERSQFNTFDLFSHFLSNIVIWAPGNPSGLEAEVRKALASIDPNLVIYGVDPYSKILAGDFQQENMIATLTMLFGVFGLALAAVGLYGVMAYSVEQGTSETACVWLSVPIALAWSAWACAAPSSRSASDSASVSRSPSSPAGS